MLVSSVVLGLLALAPPAKPDALPLQRLRIYETGVAYFERHGSVSSADPATLPVPAGHLDDALKTLVIVARDGQARIRSIDFDSIVSEEMARTMAGLPSTPGEPLDFEALLRSLEGLPVELRLGTDRLSGRLVEVQGPFKPEAPPAADEDLQAKLRDIEPYYHLMFIDGDGAIRRLSSRDVTSIRPRDEGSRTRLQVASERLSSQRARVRQALSVSVQGRGTIGFGYIAEAPVWRTSYRVVLGSDGERGHLQGWALIHNDSDEDWNDVAVELANGRPRSFLYPLAEPMYAQRDVELPDDDLQSVPQLGGAMVGDVISESYGLGNVGLVGYGAGGGGSASGSAGVGRSASPGVVGHSETFGLGDLAELSKASGEETGVMFVYRCPELLDIEAHRSALVPIVQDEVVAESITWFEPDQSDGQTAARVINSTPQTWPAGTVSFFQNGGFIGETKLDRLKPSERRFLTFGEDLDLHLQRSWETLGHRVHDLRYVDGVLIEHLVEHRKVKLQLDNRSGQPRTAYVGLPLQRNAELTGAELDFDHERQVPLVVVDVPAGEEVEQVVEAKLPFTTRHETITLEALTTIGERDGWPAPIRTVLDRAIDRAKARAAVRHALTDVERQQLQVQARVARFHDDLSALGRADAPRMATANASKKLMDAQDELTELVERADELRKSIDAHSKQLAEILEPLAP